VREFLFTVLLAAHLLCVNVASGAPILAIACEWGDAKGSLLARRAGQYLSWAALISLIAGLVIGLALFALRWSPQYSAAVSRLHYKLGWGGGELAFSLVLMMIAVGLWLGTEPSATWLRRLRGFLSLLNGANLLYHFPFLFLILSKLAAEETMAGETITAETFRGLMFAGATPALAVHVIFASLAMSGIALLGFALRLQREEANPTDAKTIASWGAVAALLPTLAQIPTGLWILTSLPALDQSRLMGVNADGICFLVSLGLALWLMQTLAAIAAGDSTRRMLITAMATSTSVVVLMTFAWRK
jgi:hypothetical protein